MRHSHKQQRSWSCCAHVDVPVGWIEAVPRSRIAGSLGMASAELMAQQHEADGLLVVEAQARERAPHGGDGRRLFLVHGAAGRRGGVWAEVGGGQPRAAGVVRSVAEGAAPLAVFFRGLLIGVVEAPATQRHRCEHSARFPAARRSFAFVTRSRRGSPARRTPQWPPYPPARTDRPG